MKDQAATAETAGDIVFCKHCWQFLHEDESGYGFCGRDYQPRRYSDLCIYENRNNKNNINGTRV